PASRPAAVQNLTLCSDLFDSNAPPPERDFHHGTVTNQAWNQPAIGLGKLTISATCYLLVNVSLPYQQVVGLYLRRNSLPTAAVRHDFFHRLVNVQSQKKAHALPVVHLAQTGCLVRVAISTIRPSFKSAPGNADLDYLTRPTDRLATAAASNLGACQSGVCHCFARGDIQRARRLLAGDGHQANEEAPRPAIANSSAALGYFAIYYWPFSGFSRIRICRIRFREEATGATYEDAVQVCSGNGYFDAASVVAHPQWKGLRTGSRALTECLDPLCSRQWALALAVNSAARLASHVRRSCAE
uniref:SRCR domain-containing protein n=1 Tax=Macrostomum lignano TaxID=282301 RepID=A0A1I8FAF4_9PLAT